MDVHVIVLGQKIPQSPSQTPTPVESIHYLKPVVQKYSYDKIASKKVSGTVQFKSELLDNELFYNLHCLHSSDRQAPQQSSELC